MHCNEKKVEHSMDIDDPRHNVANDDGNEMANINSLNDK